MVKSCPAHVLQDFLLYIQNEPISVYDIARAEHLKPILVLVIEPTCASLQHNFSHQIYCHFDLRNIFEHKFAKCVMNIKISQYFYLPNVPMCLNECYETKKNIYWYRFT